jgi:putative ABC transport system permease protein
VRFYGSLEDGESYMPHLVFKVNKMDETTIGKLKEAISKALDGKDVQLKVYADEMHSAYEDSRKMRNTVFIGSIFALMIAMLGLIGFIRDESSRRSKEMAIRKINGATERDVLSIFAWGVLKLSLIMSIFACVFAYFVADKWLEQFAERIGLSPLYFIFGATVVLLIVAIVVVMSSIRIARTNPAEALKKE